MGCRGWQIPSADSILMRLVLLKHLRYFSTLLPLQVTGAISCEISNNIIVASDTGNRITMDVMQGTATNQVGISVTSTLTGNNNYHSGGSAGTGRRARINNVDKFATFTGDFGAQSLWSAATTPFDTACVWTAPGVRAAIDEIIPTFKPTCPPTSTTLGKPGLQMSVRCIWTGCSTVTTERRLLVRLTQIRSAQLPLFNTRRCQTPARLTSGLFYACNSPHPPRVRVLNILPHRLHA